MSFDIENWVKCHQGDACVSPNLSEENKPLVPRVPLPREAICFHCIEALAHEINNEPSNGRKSVKVKEFERRVMGLE